MEALTGTYLSNCPPDRDELGNHTWALLHTLGAYFPKEPSLQHQSYANILMLSLSKLYPCEICAEDFERFVQENPPNTSSRESFSLWICELHNHVNEKLGKSVLPCTIKDLDIRWKTGEGECAIVDPNKSREVLRNSE